MPIFLVTFHLFIFPNCLTYIYFTNPYSSTRLIYFSIHTFLSVTLSPSLSLPLNFHLPPHFSPSLASIFLHSSSRRPPLASVHLTFTFPLWFSSHLPLFALILLSFIFFPLSGIFPISRFPLDTLLFRLLTRCLFVEAFLDLYSNIHHCFVPFPWTLLLIPVLKSSRLLWGLDLCYTWSVSSFLFCLANFT